MSEGMLSIGCNPIIQQLIRDNFCTCLNYSDALLTEYGFRGLSTTAIKIYDAALTHFSFVHTNTVGSHAIIQQDVVVNIS